jgi:putative glutamine amidotransferase
MSRTRPVIGLPADRRIIGHHPFHAVGEKYLLAVAEAADAIPLVIPALADHFSVAEILDAVDGLVFTGSVSNVEPLRYAGPTSEPGTLHDTARDATTLPLIPAAIEQGIPVLGICRGFQEMNVAYGGTLHQKLQQVPGYLDHREDETQPLDVQYGPAHDVILEKGGVLRGLAGTDRIRVNSLHGQGVDRLADRLIVEARAPDGVIEAFRVRNAPRFALAVQWHPEWKAMSNDFSRALFGAFGASTRERLKG